MLLDTSLFTAPERRSISSWLELDPEDLTPEEMAEFKEAVILVMGMPDEGILDGADTGFTRSFLKPDPPKRAGWEANLKPVSRGIGIRESWQ